MVGGLGGAEGRTPTTDDAYRWGGGCAARARGLLVTLCVGYRRHRCIHGVAAAAARDHADTDKAWRCPRGPREWGNGALQHRVMALFMSRKALPPIRCPPSPFTAAPVIGQPRHSAELPRTTYTASERTTHAHAKKKKRRSSSSTLAPTPRRRHWRRLLQPDRCRYALAVDLRQTAFSNAPRRSALAPVLRVVCAPHYPPSPPLPRVGRVRHGIRDAKSARRIGAPRCLPPGGS